MQQLQRHLVLPLALLIVFAATCIAQQSRRALLPSVGDADLRYEALFRPFLTNQATLSPDGRYLAYTLKEADTLAVVVLEIDHPEKVVAKIIVVSDEQATGMLSIHSKERTPGNIRWLRWVTNSCLVMETNRRFPFNLELTAQNTSDTSWFNCPGEILSFDVSTLKARSLVTPRDTAEWISHPSIKGNHVPRTPHIVDVDNTDPTAIVIQAEGFPRFSGLRYVERYRLNVLTGKLKSTGVHILQIGRAYLFDRQGRPRVSIPTSIQIPFPHPFSFDSGAMLKRWKPFGELTGSELLPPFLLSPENHFSRRAVPLGFGLDGSILYFASNADHDTYGIYGLDMKTGKKTEFIAESTIFDLYAPESGVFPDTTQGTLTNDEHSLGTDVPADTPKDAQSAFGSLGVVPADTTADNRDTAIVFRLGMAGQLAPLTGSDKDNPLIYDRFTHDITGFRYAGKVKTATWFNSKINAAQQVMERQFPGQSVEIIEWNTDYSRYLACIRNPVDSGAYYIFDADKPRLAEYVGRAPWMERNGLPEVSDFSFAAPEGHTISGTLTFPRAARAVPVPVIVLCPENPWDRVSSEYQADLLVLAKMGFAVVQTNTRGTWGFGVKKREMTTQKFDQAQIEDIGNALDHLAKQYAIDRNKIAVMGAKHGGYLALRALQLQPDRYRCAVALDPVLDVKGWIDASRWSNKASAPSLVAGFFGNPDKLDKSPILGNPELFSRPVLLLSYRGEPGKPELPSYVTAKSVSLALKRRDVPAELYDLTDDYMSGLPGGRSMAFRHIEEFLNERIYDYTVKMGDLRIIK